MAEPSIGSVLAGYRIDGLIARGGMGVVYRATHLALDRPVALKVVARHLADDPAFRERFLSESRLAARLEHPSVVPIYDAREEGGDLFVAMRLIPGGDLKRRIASKGPLPAEQAIELLGQVADALDAAHAAGIVHRDVKPHNILLEGERRAFLTDFGLAKALGDSGVLSGASIAGTAEYMSPEQWRGERVGPAADVYSLGCVLYEALTGIVPYARRDADVEPEMPAGLDQVIERAVSREPGRRYASAGAMIEAARRHQGATPTATRVLTGSSGRRTDPLGTWAAVRRRLRGAPRPLLLAVPALIGLAVLAASILTGGGGVSTSTVAVGGGPLRIGTGDGQVWVASRQGTLTRIDRAAPRVALRAEAGEEIAGVAVGEGSVWASAPRSGEVLRIDPSTGRVVQRIDVGGRPGALAYGGRRVWVADEAGAGVTAINAAGSHLLRRGIPPHAAPLRLAVGAGGLWVSSASTGSVRRIDLGDATAGPPIPVGRGPSGLTVGHGEVWIANSRSDTVTRLDPATHALLGEPVQVGDRPGGIDAGTSVVWVANAGDDTLSRLDVDTGEPLGGPVSVGRDPGAVAVDEDYVWVADNGDGTVTRIVP